MPNMVFHKSISKKLETSQRATERKMLNVKLKDRNKVTVDHKRNKVTVDHKRNKVTVDNS